MAAVRWWPAGGSVTRRCWNFSPTCCEYTCRSAEPHRYGFLRSLGQEVTIGTAAL